MISAISIALMLLLALGVASSVHAEVGGAVHETSQQSASAHAVKESDPAFKSGNAGGAAVCVVGVLLGLAVLRRVREFCRSMSHSPDNDSFPCQRPSVITFPPVRPPTTSSLTQLRISRT